MPITRYVWIYTPSLVFLAGCSKCQFCLTSRITLYVDKDGRAFLEKQEVSLNNLFIRLKEEIGGEKDKLVVIKADRAVILNKAVNVMDIAKAAGAGRLFLATEK